MNITGNSFYNINAGRPSFSAIYKVTPKKVSARESVRKSKKYNHLLPHNYSYPVSENMITSSAVNRIKTSGVESVNVNDVPHLKQEIFDNGQRLVRKTSLRNRITKKREPVYILKNKDGVYSIHNNNEKLGKMVLKKAGTGLINPEQFTNVSSAYKNKNYVEIHLLETKNNGRDAGAYRGIGTELVKQAIIESYDEGHGGRIALVAANYKLGGRDAAGFYKKLGFEHCGPGNEYSLPEIRIANLLMK